ncbi:MAG: hypothetical protein ACI9JL_000918 [Paracoccaceae bacterium]|jgi:hypothetical protein
MTDTPMTDTPEIRRHPDGSIDTKHYMQIGRQCRSEALYDSGHAIAGFGSVVSQAVRRIWSRPVTQRSGNIFAEI